MSVRPRTLARPLALIGAGLALAACSGTAAVPASDVEQKISDQLEAQVGTAPDGVSCPEDLPAEEGAEMTCVLTAGEDTIDVAVTVTGVDGGDVAFDIKVADAVNE